MSIFFGLIYGFKLKDHWEQFALYWYQPGTTFHDPIFGKSLGFYLFSLPLYDALSSWLLGVTFIILVAALSYSTLGLPQTVLKPSVRWSSGWRSRGVLRACTVSARVELAHLSVAFSFLWEDHATFSGVTYTDANYTLPALFVSIALIIAAVISLVNAFVARRLSLLLIAVAIPVAVYVVGVVLIPTYIQSFVVKPNELERETPYISHNMEWTRRGFGLDQIESREFDPETSNCRLGQQSRDARKHSPVGLARASGHAATNSGHSHLLRLSDVDVDRYVRRARLSMMIAPREIDDIAPTQSRNGSTNA